MAIKNKTELKGFFEKGDKPTEQQFADLIDSFAHLNADGSLRIPYSDSPIDPDSNAPSLLVTGDAKITGGTTLSGGLQLNHTDQAPYIQIVDAEKNIPFIVTKDGKVGIGADSPSTKLHIEGDKIDSPTVEQKKNGEILAGISKEVPGGLGPVLSLNNLGSIEGSSSAIDFLHGKDGFPAFRIQSSPYFGSDPYNGLSFHASAFRKDLNELMRLTFDGKLGVGTSTPDAALHVSRDKSKVAIFENTNPYSSGTYIEIKDIKKPEENFYPVTLGNYKGNFYLGTYKKEGDHGLAEISNLIITSNGNVGIGMGLSTPDAMLHVAEDLKVGGKLYIGATDIAQAIENVQAKIGDELTLGNSTNNNGQLVVFGKVGIGMTDPNYSLHVAAGGVKLGGLIIEENKSNEGNSIICKVDDVTDPVNQNIHFNLNYHPVGTTVLKTVNPTFQLQCKTGVDGLSRPALDLHNPKEFIENEEQLLVISFSHHAQKEYSGSIKPRVGAAIAVKFPNVVDNQFHNNYQYQYDYKSHLLFYTSDKDGHLTDRMVIDHEGQVLVKGDLKLEGKYKGDLTVIPDNKDSTAKLILRAYNEYDKKSYLGCVGKIDFNDNEEAHRDQDLPVIRIEGHKLSGNGAYGNNGYLAIHGREFIDANKGYELKERVHINADGKVGIGTDTPLSKLHVKGQQNNSPGGYEKEHGEKLLVLEKQMAGGLGPILELINDGGKNSSAAIDFNVAQSHFRIVNVLIDNVGTPKHCLNFLGKSTWDNNNNLDLLMCISSDGNVGIGTSTPTKGKLTIAGSMKQAISKYGFLRGWGNNITDLAENNLTEYEYSLYADKIIAALEFHAHSDRRIKTPISRSDRPTDLATLLQLEITDYTHKDVIQHGHRTHKKVIGQQVQAVFPEAVSFVTEVVPDIYQPAKVKDNRIQLATDLKVGEKVRLISPDKAELYTVKEVTADSFTVDAELPDGGLFVYGREVDDFHLVDYEAIAMLNVSATQEVYRQLEAEKQKVQALQAAQEKLQQAFERFKKQGQEEPRA